MNTLVQFVSAPLVLFAALRLDDSKSVEEMVVFSVVFFFAAAAWAIAWATGWEQQHLLRQENDALRHLGAGKDDTIRHLRQQHLIPPPQPPKPPVLEGSRLVRPDDRTFEVPIPKLDHTEALVKIHVMPGQGGRVLPFQYGAETEVLNLEPEPDVGEGPEQTDAATPVPVGTEEGS